MRKNLITKSSMWGGRALRVQTPQKPPASDETQPKPPSLFERRHFVGLDQCRSSWHAKTKTVFVFNNNFLHEIS